jgi:hypothetical protein
MLKRFVDFAVGNDPRLSTMFSSLSPSDRTEATAMITQMLNHPKAGVVGADRGKALASAAMEAFNRDRIQDVKAVGNWIKDMRNLLLNLSPAHVSRFSGVEEEKLAPKRVSEQAAKAPEPAPEAPKPLPELTAGSATFVRDLIKRLGASGSFSPLVGGRIGQMVIKQFTRSGDMVVGADKEIVGVSDRLRAAVKKLEGVKPSVPAPERVSGQDKKVADEPGLPGSLSKIVGAMKGPAKKYAEAVRSALLADDYEDSDDLPDAEDFGVAPNSKRSIDRSLLGAVKRHESQKALAEAAAKVEEKLAPQRVSEQAAKAPESAEQPKAKPEPKPEYKALSSKELKAAVASASTRGDYSKILDRLKKDTRETGFSDDFKVGGKEFGYAPSGQFTRKPAGSDQAPMLVDQKQVLREIMREHKAAQPVPKLPSPGQKISVKGIPGKVTVVKIEGGKVYARNARGMPVIFKVERLGVKSAAPKAEAPKPKAKPAPAPKRVSEKAKKVEEPKAKPKVEAKPELTVPRDVTAELTHKVGVGADAYIAESHKHLVRAKPAKPDKIGNLSATQQAMLDKFTDTTLESSSLAYADPFKGLKKREHAALVSLMRGGYLKVEERSGVVPEKRKFTPIGEGAKSHYAIVPGVEHPRADIDAQGHPKLSAIPEHKRATPYELGGLNYSRKKGMDELDKLRAAVPGLGGSHDTTIGNMRVTVEGGTVELNGKPIALISKDEMTAVDKTKVLDTIEAHLSKQPGLEEYRDIVVMQSSALAAAKRGDHDIAANYMKDAEDHYFVHGDKRYLSAHQVGAKLAITKRQVEAYKKKAETKPVPERVSEKAKKVEESKPKAVEAEKKLEVGQARAATPTAEEKAKYPHDKWSKGKYKPSIRPGQEMADVEAHTKGVWAVDTRDKDTPSGKKKHAVITHIPSGRIAHYADNASHAKDIVDKWIAEDETRAHFGANVPHGPKDTEQMKHMIAHMNEGGHVARLQEINGELRQEREQKKAGEAEKKKVKLTEEPKRLHRTARGVTDEEHKKSQNVSVNVKPETASQIDTGEPYKFRGHTIERMGGRVVVTMPDGENLHVRGGNVPEKINNAFKLVKWNLKGKPDKAETERVSEKAKKENPSKASWAQLQSEARKLRDAGDTAKALEKAEGS